MGRGYLITVLTKYIHFFVLFNAVFVTYGIPYLYVLFMTFSMFFCSLKGIDRDCFSRYTGHLIYILLLIVITFFNMIIGSQDITALVTLGLYTLPVFFWILYYTQLNHIDFKNIFSSLFFFSAIVSLLGILQYFFSPSLWGNIPTESKSIAWAMEKTFIEYAAFFRSTSTLGSPQVFGLFCALSLILAHRFKFLIKKNLFLTGSFLLFVGGALSGNKSFFLIIFVYILAIYAARYIFKLKYIFLILLCIIGLITAQKTIISNIPMLERIFSFEKISEQENNDSRLAKYSYIIEHSDFFIGNGMGKDVVLKHKELTATESYIFKIYFECGFIASSLLCILMISTMIKAWFKSFDDFIIVTLIFFSMVIVHAFQSPVFFIFWGYLLSFFKKDNDSRKLHFKAI